MSIPSSLRFNHFKLLPIGRRRGLALGIAIITATLIGCANPSLHDQVNLSRPGMIFSDSPTLADTGSLLSTIEPGSDDRGGASASGCTVCR